MFWLIFVFCFFPKKFKNREWRMLFLEVVDMFECRLFCDSVILMQSSVGWWVCVLLLILLILSWGHYWFLQCEHKLQFERIHWNSEQENESVFKSIAPNRFIQQIRLHLNTEIWFLSVWSKKRRRSVRIHKTGLARMNSDGSAAECFTVLWYPLSV